MLNREQILAANDAQTKDVDVPEWGGTVRIAVMSGAARDALQSAIDQKKGNAYFEASLVVATVVDSTGAQLFTEDDIDALRAKSAPVLTRVAAEAMAINKIGEAATEKAVKNSEAAPSGDSGTA
jgi:hypothetical protein